MTGVQSAEDQRQLLSLAQADEGSVLHDKIVNNPPEWSHFERSGYLPTGGADWLKSFHRLSLPDKSESIGNDPTACAIVFSAVAIEAEPQPAQYALTILYDIVRDDSSRYDAIGKNLPDLDLYKAFSSVLLRPHLDAYTGDKAAVLLCGFMCRLTRRFTEDQVKFVLGQLVSGKYRASDGGRLEAFGNILKIDAYRVMFWHIPKSPSIILQSINAGLPASVLYRSLFCAWLLSFNPDTLDGLIGTDFVPRLRMVLAESRVEKVVRISVQTIHNLMEKKKRDENSPAPQNETAIEKLVEENVVQSLQLLEYEKWRDPELYEEIRQVIAELHNKIKVYSNFERYERELQSGKLEWGFLHGEKFWFENVQRFEENEYRAVKQLFELLRSEDSTTLAVACHDLGEFARLHPMGKKMLQRLHAKEVIMGLLAHKEREVAREALLCVQKLMIERWQDAAIGAPAATR
uniref:V-type proton ATPase subunit H n=1 Tax=Chromera velia CCMP2878 TaxID=1169474 RepID=A0A0G4IFP4_9ALVE|mmetsp:Transcript_24895/g.48751  ORF Transcript_24895/g.48751 Transcript_24895/m.48751 type:complete len:461 (+) Transcript_24895:134-1516(+)|eukprot:Cvel_14032.t1-p1 / transcript=Cvel_14032.t1 / gene=Cvel_14032 / organism=Chromera_velia_CCMP2878 / gene_product=V-type proton ATPase subunit H, putative / transcript_product=V-type proton ATPase subunit H, putative / location=Cvel_scaffold983:17464-24384(+) / protein_length=460 / sequence_SO=supercontig / SO=protein_coding / is_pseudo=false